MPSFARTLLAELILREMHFDPRNRPYLDALRPVLRVALRENNWAAQATASGIPIEVLRRATAALRQIFWQCGAEVGGDTQIEGPTAPAATLPLPKARGGRPPSSGCSSKRR